MDKIKKDLIDLFNLDQLPPEKSVEMVERLSKMIFQSILMRVVPLLNEEKMAQYEKIVDRGDGGELFAFLQENIPNFNEIIKEESEQLYEELSGDLKNTGINNTE